MTHFQTDAEVQEKYDESFMADLQSCIEREQLLKHSLGPESCDDSNQDAAKEPVRTCPKMTFEHGDITEGIRCPNESFDLVTCKKTLDIVLCGAGSVANMRSMMTECFRLLNKDHGAMMMFSSAKPEDRAVYFECDNWAGVENVKLPSKEDGQFEQRKGHEKQVEHTCIVL